MERARRLISDIRRLHEQIRDEVVSACEATSPQKLAQVAHEAEEDTIYAIDRISEQRLLQFFEKEIAVHTPVVLIAEGLPENEVILPTGTSEKDIEFRVIVDPIDGTRGLMYQKRSAWILTGVAPNRHESTDLDDIEFAIQTEIPLVKQHLSDMLWAFKGGGCKAQRYNRLTGHYDDLGLTPSQAKTIAHGFAMISRFFPGAREVLAEIDEEVVHASLGDIQPGRAHCFEDQYISTGGQLYELICGHDRFVADLRPLMEKVLAKRSLALGICCHPYDICTELIARESGVTVVDALGNRLQSKLTVTDDVSWVAYSNAAIRAQVEPHLQRALRARDLI